jgi:hypothetical protein
MKDARTLRRELNAIRRREFPTADELQRREDELLKEIARITREDTVEYGDNLYFKVR